MKRREMNSVAGSLCSYLMSRNNDIIGYWGIGFICRVAEKERRNKISFKIYPGKPIRICNYELSSSTDITQKLTKYGLDSIEGRLSFFEDGRFPNGSKKYTCGIAISLTQDGRTGMHISHVACRSHDPNMESRSTRYTPPKANNHQLGAASVLDRIRTALTRGSNRSQ